MQVGDIVLFLIHEDPPVWRPLLVVAETEDGLTGELFLDPDEDRSAEWVQKNMFYLPQRETRTVAVYRVVRGDGLGQWREK
jgi:hypothetical protein